MQIEMYELLCKAQEMIARKYPTILTDKSKRGEIKNYIAQFLYGTTWEQAIADGLTEAYNEDE